MKGYTYILQVSNGQYYVGSTYNLELRIAEHQNGEGAKFTKAHLPVKLVYYEEYDRIDEAFRREKQLQGWSRAKKEALINGDLEKLRMLASTGSATDASTPSTGSATDASTPSTGSATDASTPSTGSGTEAATTIVPPEL